MRKLKACPYCGWTNDAMPNVIKFRRPGDGLGGPNPNGCFYECGECGAQGPWEPWPGDDGAGDAAAKAEARDRWNQRTKAR